MGHGDVLILADTNFPSDSIARATVTGRLLRMENLTAAQAVEAILSVLPLDTFVDDFAGRMEVSGQPDTIPPVQAEVQAAIDRAEGRPRPMVGIERFAFYDFARECLRRHPDGRAALLRLLHVPQGGHPAGRLRTVSRPALSGPTGWSRGPEPRDTPGSRGRRGRPSRCGRGRRRGA